MSKETEYFEKAVQDFKESINDTGMFKFMRNNIKLCAYGATSALLILIIFY